MPVRSGSPTTNKTQDVQILPQRQNNALRMNIPKNYFEQESKTADVGQTQDNDDALGGHARLTSDASDSFKLSNQDPIAIARQKHEQSLEQRVETNDSRRILSRFLEDETDYEALKQTQDKLKEKVLTQFPIFALNEDYMRAITLIIMDKLQRAEHLTQQISS